MGILRSSMHADPLELKVLQFVEAPAFSRFRDDYLDDDSFADLQRGIAANPEAGDLIPGAGGIRKLRWKDSRRGKGKRGGLRVIYYAFLADEEIWVADVIRQGQGSGPDEGSTRSTPSHA